MKTYFRLLSFSKPYGSYVPKYLLLIIPAIILGTINFSLFIPLLDILFGTIEIKKEILFPHFSWSINYLRDIFYHYFYITIQYYGKTGALEFVCCVILAFIFLTNLFRYLSQRVLTSMRTRVVKNIQEQLFTQLTVFPLSYFHQKQKGDIMSSVSNDVHEIENSVVSSIQVIFRDPLMIIGYFILLFALSFKLTVFTILFLPVSGFIISYISKRLRKEAAISQKLLGNILSITEEAISGTRIIKAFNAHRQVRKKFDVHNDAYRKITKSIINKRELASPVSEFLGVLVVSCVMIYGGRLVLQQQSELSASAFLTYIILYSQILSPAKNISVAVTNIQRGLAAGERVLQIIDTPPEISEPEGAVSIHSFEKEIEYKNVSFAYRKGDTGWILKDINFIIPKGKTVALVGQSGAGKSTLADLLPLFYHTDSGDILIDGVSLKKLKPCELRKLMGIVTQESILFNDTIFNNIAFGEKPDKKEVIRAAQIANAHDFIMEMEYGYETNIGDRGGRLSGGQKQRISIARAVFKNPPILILDEATSALDTESEKLVQDALLHLMQNRTTLVIAHRLSTIQYADEIIVLQKGQIAERGNHLQLLEQNGVYRKLYDLQTFA